MNILSRANLEMHKERPRTPRDKVLTLWQPEPDFIHCCVQSCGCRYSRNAGACIMCDYGIGCNVEPDELANALEQQLAPKIPYTKRMLFGTYGSILDESEISLECFSVILDFIRKHQILTVIFETHCDTVNPAKLEMIKNKLSPKTEIIIEMGYETCDNYVLHHCLNKSLDLNVLDRAVAMIKEAGMTVCLNVFVGAPFLNSSDQMKTAIESIQWAKDRGVESLVLFPANIKPFTLLHKLYLAGQYSPISQWMLPLLLQKLNEDILDRISFSWYGDRQSFYENNQYPLLPPEDCDLCHEILFDFYKNFLRTKGSEDRKRLIDDLLSAKIDCNCKEKLLSSLEVFPKRKSEEEIQQIILSL